MKKRSSVPCRNDDGCWPRSINLFFNTYHHPACVCKPHAGQRRVPMKSRLPNAPLFFVGIVCRALKSDWVITSPPSYIVYMRMWWHSCGMRCCRFVWRNLLWGCRWYFWHHALTADLSSRLICTNVVLFAIAKYHGGGALNFGECWGVWNASKYGECVQGSNVMLTQEAWPHTRKLWPIYIYSRSQRKRTGGARLCLRVRAFRFVFLGVEGAGRKELSHDKF